jgi:Cu+-exporting ATPase
MEVDSETAREQKEHEGEIYFFCSAGCREKFEEEPKRFAHDRPNDGGEI